MKVIKIYKRSSAVALFIALVPPAWAVLAPYLGVTVGAIALISAGLFVAAGNQNQNKWRILFGLWLGIPFGILDVILPGLTAFPQTTLYLVTSALGASVILLGALPAVNRWIDSAAWLTGMAIVVVALMINSNPLKFGTLPLEIMVAMFAGVFGIGVLGNIFADYLVDTNKKPSN